MDPGSKLPRQPEKTKRRFQNIFGGRPSVQGQIRGDGSIFRGMTRMKGFVIEPKLSRKPPPWAGNRECILSAARSVAQFRARRSAAQTPAGSGRVKAFIVVAR
jgi:hypothetical protein